MGAAARITVSMATKVAQEDIVRNGALADGRCGWKAVATPGSLPQ